MQKIPKSTLEWQNYHLSPLKLWVRTPFMAIQHYVIKFVSDLRQGSGFLRVLRIPPPIKLTTTIYICNWNIVESGVKHHKSISLYIKQVCIQVLDSIWFYININFFLSFRSNLQCCNNNISRGKRWTVFLIPGRHKRNPRGGNSNMWIYRRQRAINRRVFKCNGWQNSPSKTGVCALFASICKELLAWNLQKEKLWISYLW